MLAYFDVALTSLGFTSTSLGTSYQKPGFGILGVLVKTHRSLTQPLLRASFKLVKFEIFTTKNGSSLCEIVMGLHTKTDGRIRARVKKAEQRMSIWRGAHWLCYRWDWPLGRNS